MFTFSPASVVYSAEPSKYKFFFFLPSHLFPVFEGRLATPGILPEQLNRGHITRFLSLRPPSPFSQYRTVQVPRPKPSRTSRLLYRGCTFLRTYLHVPLTSPSPCSTQRLHGKVATDSLDRNNNGLTGGTSNVRGRTDSVWNAFVGKRAGSKKRLSSMLSRKKKTFQERGVHVHDL